jgi:2-iminobutanoate/2-iminopropanoate deaminase
MPAGARSSKAAAGRATRRQAKLALARTLLLTETKMQTAKRYLKRETAQARAYSQAVVSDGGRIVWLAGQTGGADAAGRSLAGDFDGQVREVFARLGATLAEAGGRLADMVTMTVFITEARFGDRFTELRKEIFGDDFPASALITVKGLARPELLVEVQGIAVLG